MAKTYGDRWKLTENASIGQGGQGYVYRVTDARGELTGEYALKRVINPKRAERFRNEIEAIKRLNHPNIIRLIDHAALDASATGESQFLVMPIAEGGDLSRPDRLGLYEGSIDAVLQVSLQLAAGLKAAHEAGIIHRDVKPQNILFSGLGHNVWITDFGICLLREKSRITDLGEVVGPRAFMAPELEDGGELAVTAAADVYSLGKVIFYMISGGTIMPREKLREIPYAVVLANGERNHLLAMLLDSMVCKLDIRIKTMEEVITRLEKIQSWEQEARLLPVSGAGLGAIERLQQKAQETQRAISSNSSAREQEEATLSAVKSSFDAWARAELEKLSSVISGGGVLSCRATELSGNLEKLFVAQISPNSGYTAISGCELQVDDVGGTFSRRHILQIRLVQKKTIVVTSHSGSSAPPPVHPARDLELALIPFYRQTTIHQPPGGASSLGFLTKIANIGVIRGQLNWQQAGRGNSPGLAMRRAEAVTGTFHPDITQWLPFRASEWPANSEAVRAALVEAVDAFVAYIESGAISRGQ